MRLPWPYSTKTHHTQNNIIKIILSGLVQLLPIMSISTYSIQVYNDSGIPQNYLLFQSAPQLSGDGTVFTNVFQQSQQIPSGDNSNVIFNMTNQYYAVIGTAPTPIDDGVKVNTSSYIPVQLSSSSQGGTKAIMTTSGGRHRLLIRRCESDARVGYRKHF